MVRPQYHVYAIELSKDALLEPRFRDCIPGYSVGKPCVYVSMKGPDSDPRVDTHMAGIQANA